MSNFRVVALRYTGLSNARQVYLVQTGSKPKYWNPSVAEGGLDFSHVFISNFQEQTLEFTDKL